MTWRKIFNRKLSSTIALLIWIWVTIFVSAPLTLASENFDIKLQTSYQVQENGNTRITHSFEVINKKPTVALTKYALKFGSTDISNVVVKLGNKEIPAEVVTTNNQTSVAITFPDKVVGQGKSRKFKISFSNPDTAIVSGQVLEVVIPKLQNSEEFSEYSISLKTPVRFGSPTRVIPANYTTRISKNQVITTFDQIRGESIIALFGDNQFFDMTLRYNLENPHSEPRLTQVALPPDTSFQKMYYQSLDPLPKEMAIDKDGNWIATYYLPANATTVVLLNAQAHVFLEPDLSIPVLTPTEDTLSSQEFWDLNHPVIQDITKHMTEPRQAYDYVVDTLSYNYDRLDSSIARLGAVAAFQSPDQALCQEFSDSFITLSRAIGIPSRRITGFAYTENETLRPLSLVEDVLHAWPEYYDSEKSLWIPIDPTWDNTSGGINYFDQFDLNHVVFAINSSDSKTPYPAGSYKTPDQNTKDVEVKFGESIIKSPLALAFATRATTLTNTNLKIPILEKITVTNRTGQAHYQVPITITTDDPSIKLLPQATIELESILPFQTKQLPITVTVDGWLLPKTVDIDITYEDRTETITITAIPKVWQAKDTPYFLAGLGGVITITVISIRGLLVFRQKRQDTLRRQSQKS